MRAAVPGDEQRLTGSVRETAVVFLHHPAHAGAMGRALDRLQAFLIAHTWKALPEERKEHTRHRKSNAKIRHAIRNLA